MSTSSTNRSFCHSPYIVLCIFVNIPGSHGIVHICFILIQMFSRTARESKERLSGAMDHSPAADWLAADVQSRTQEYEQINDHYGLEQQRTHDTTKESSRSWLTTEHSDSWQTQRDNIPKHAGSRNIQESTDVWKTPRPNMPDHSDPTTRARGSDGVMAIVRWPTQENVPADVSRKPDSRNQRKKRAREQRRKEMEKLKEVSSVTASDMGIKSEGLAQVELNMLQRQALRIQQKKEVCAQRKREKKQLKEAPSIVAPDIGTISEGLAQVELNMLHRQALRTQHKKEVRAQRRKEKKQLKKSSSIVACGVGIRSEGLAQVEPNMPQGQEQAGEPMDLDPTGPQQAYQYRRNKFRSQTPSLVNASNNRLLLSDENDLDPSLAPRLTQEATLTALLPIASLIGPNSKRMRRTKRQERRARLDAALPQKVADLENLIVKLERDDPKFFNKQIRARKNELTQKRNQLAKVESKLSRRQANEAAELLKKYGKLDGEGIVDYDFGRRMDELTQSLAGMTNTEDSRESRMTG